MVSLGTGRVPVVPRHHIDMFRPSGIADGVKVVRGVQAFIEMLIDQVSTVELQWLKYLWNHENKFETWLNQANEC